MKNFLFKAKCTLLIPLITACAMTSCVEDEKSPFINDYEETIDVKLPGGKIFYIGSEVELRGSGFTSGDKIYVKNTNDISQRVIEARVQSYYDTRLFFIMPADIGDTAYEVEVTLSRYGETYDKEYENDSGGYEDDVICIRPYDWGFEEEPEMVSRPNLLFKPAGFNMGWYKYPWRGGGGHVREPERR